MEGEAVENSEIVIIIKYPSPSSWFKLISCGNISEEIAKEKIINQYQLWHVYPVNIYGHIECANSEILKDSIYHKFGKKLHESSMLNGWVNATIQEFQNCVKKIAVKQNNAKVVLVKKPERKKKTAKQENPGDDDQA